MTKFNVLPIIEHINYFKYAGVNKFQNGVQNKIRENIITNMFNLNDNYFNDPYFGSDWKNLQNKFINSVSTLCEIPFQKIILEPVGGMSYNYDFNLSFLDKNKNKIKKIKLEFKHNNSDISKLVQFMELYDKDCKDKFNLCSEMSYTEYYYNNYLDKYLQTDNELIYKKPEKREYLKYVSDISYRHEFFNLLYKKKDNQLNNKKKVANESVIEYLKLYSSTFNFDKVTEKIKESQRNKVYLLWDCENFHTQILDVENMSMSRIKKMNNLSFDVNVENFNYDICVRLRWANNNGLVNPSWKFSFINK